MNPFDPFEQQLREAFRRVEPPAELAGKILRQAARKQARPWRAWLAAAASVLVVAGGTLGIAHWQQQRQRQMEAERVKEQLALTLRITSRTLARADQRLRSIGVEQIQLRENSSWQE